MKFKPMLCLLLSICALLGISGSALAAQVDCDSVYCFSQADFSTDEEPLTGICITGLPQANTGTVMLGQRVLQKGDILTAEQLEQLVFCPLRTEEDATATVTYLPIYENRVETAVTATISIRGKEDLPPVAQDSSLETYKNLPNKGMLKVTDPEGCELTYTVIRQPKRGTVTLSPDGSFEYTPKKNKVGVDSFTYTATDPAGKVSREATVNIQILKPTAGKQYTDTAGTDCRFEAEWLRNTGLFVGETIGGQSCFQPEKTVSRGEFLTMLVDTLRIPTENAQTSALEQQVPQWLRPYMAAALRSGLLNGLELDNLEMDAPITGAEAAVMVQNALDLQVGADALEQVAAQDDGTPQWAAASLTTLAYHGIELNPTQAMTRGDAAKFLYEIDYISLTAPGVQVIRKQK